LAASGTPWSPDRVRGRGCWRDSEGGLVVYCGDAVLYRDVWRPPGMIEEFVYPAAPALTRRELLEDPRQLAGPGQVLLNRFNK
jgi:hypothetical protein